MQQNESMNRDLARIEADLELERSALANNLAKLGSRLTMDSLMSEASNLVKGNLGPLTRGIDRKVRANPLAVAVIGAGVAWLVFGRRGAQDRATPDLAGTRYEALTRWEDEGGPPAPLPEPDCAEWLEETDRLHSHAIQALGRIAAAAKDRIGVSDLTAADRAAVVARFASDARRALRRGLEDLPAATQDRIIALREKAYLVHRSAVQNTGRMIEDEPMLAGCLAMALGAGLAAALPATAVEDRLVGAERDRLVDQAKEVLQHERARAAVVLADLAGTLRHELHAAVA